MKWFTSLSEEAQVVLCLAAITVTPLVILALTLLFLVVSNALYPNGING